MRQFCRMFFFIIVVEFLLVTPYSIAKPTKPTAVILYPKGGWIQISEQLEIKENKVYFELPAGSQIETLQVTVADHYIGSIETKPIIAIESPVVVKLREQYMKSSQEVAGIQGKLVAIKAKIDLWTKHEWKNSSIEDIKKIDAFMVPKLEELYIAEASILPELKKAEFRLHMLENSLKDIGGEFQYAIGVTALIQPQKTGENTHVNIQYGYMFQNCGWKPMYQINALPEKGIVQVIQNAEIYQASGQDWVDVDLTLASVDIGNSLTPPQLFSWFVRPKSQMQPRGIPSPAAETFSLPVASEENSFTTWNLGKKMVIAGIFSQIPLYKGDWNADFFRLLRPAVQDEAYLVAKIREHDPVDLIVGSGQFMVEGKIVGSGQFSVVNSDQSIPFGVDTRVTAQMFPDKSQSGRGGFIDRKQNYIWSWNITVMNEHSTPVSVVVEDPAPQLADSSISVVTQSNPSAVLEKHNYVWELTVPANAKQEIRHKIIMTAPGDMLLIEGR